METLIVFLIVGGAVAYAGWRLLPTGFKRELARRLGASETRAQQIGNAGACGSCSSCKACATPMERKAHTLPPKK